MFGLLVMSSAAGSMLLNRQPAGAVALVILLLGCLFGLLAELAALVQSTQSARVPRPPAGARQADGHVELVPLKTARSLPNPRDPRLGRFIALDPLELPADPPRPGSSPALLGRVVIISVFLGRDGQGWSDAEIAQAHDALRRAGLWIEREAIRWAAPVNIDLCDTYFAVEDNASEDVEVTFVPEGDRQAPFEANAIAKALATFTRSACQLGFADAADMIGQVGRRIEADSWVWLLHPRCAGRSLAIPESDTEWHGVTLAVCYAREANFPEPLIGPPFADPVTFAHELLHLFGASDKYTVPLHSFPPKTVTDRDVMCLNYNSLSRLRVDARTACEIGWVAAPRA